jgi:hypothetical protein
MRKLTIFVVIIALLTLGGTAIAAMDDHNNTYTGCLNSGGNILKVAIGEEPAKPCEDDQMQISWNEQGPQGLSGPMGPQGPPGEPGLSKGYWTSKGDSDLTLEPSDQPTEVMKLTLPSGDYISDITVHASYYPGGSFPADDHAFLECFVEANGEPVTGNFGTTLQGLESTSLTFPIQLGNGESDVITYCEVVISDNESITIHRANWTTIQVMPSSEE